MEKEIWKDVVWWEWYYQVSDQWNVKSLSRFRRITKRSRWTKERLLKFMKTTKWYSAVMLCRYGKMYNTSVHRLVAKHFIGIDSRQINHKNWIKTDNRVDNLEYCTNSENQKHAYSKLWKIPPRLWKFGKDNISSKPIIQYTKQWDMIKEWISASEVERNIWIWASNVWRCCLGKVKTAWWYKWSYVLSRFKIE